MTKRVGRRSPSPTNLPRGTQRPPHPQQPATYPYPRRNRGAEIVTISLLVAAFVLLGLGGMFWAVQSRLMFGPTPTPTGTPGTPSTATPDYLATRVAEDFLTQQAYQMAVLGTTTPTPLDVATASPPEEGEGGGDGGEVADEESTPQPTNTPVTVRLPGLNAPFTPTADEVNLPDLEGPPTETPTQNIVNLPIVVDSSPLATPTPAQVAEALPTETPTELPTATPTLPVDTPTATPTETQPPPSPTPTLTPIPPGQSFVVPSLQGFVGDRTAALRLGPSTVYTQVNTLEPNTRVNILGRTPSGEWLYVCCVADQPYWARHAYVRPRDNPLQSNAPEDSNPNDVRWLRIEPPPAYLPGLPTPVPPGPDDYPLARYDRHGAGRIDQLPSPPFNPGWVEADKGRAGGALVSSVSVVGSYVLVGSADNHLYGFERSTGSQRWRVEFCQDGCRIIHFAPMIYENEIFVADQNRTLSAFENPNSPALIWRVTTSQPIISSLNIFSETLFLATGESGNHTLLALDRDNGAVRWERQSSGAGLHYPVIGDQLVYAADSGVTAYDVHTGELVWQNNDIPDISAGPVYGAPGLSGLAELYVVAANNRIYALDANTGLELWNIDNGESATSLALNENTLFVAADGYLKAISRQDRNQRWRASLTNGAIMGGPLVDATYALVVTQSGTVHFFENGGGSAIAVPSIGASAAGAPAISGAYIFVPGSDGRLYALLGSQ